MRSKFVKTALAFAPAAVLMTWLWCRDERIAAQQPADAGKAAIVNRAKVPGSLRLQMRSRKPAANGTGVEIGTRAVEWKVAETAIIVCDMWDDHYCRCAKQRVNAMAPRMNQVLTAARAHGIQVIHAPSGTMATYQDTEFRKRMQKAPAVKPPVDIGGWCKLDPAYEGALPIDDSDGGCDDPNPPPAVGNYKNQHPGIDIVGPDGISDSGVEIFNFCRQEGIQNIVLMGVHTNMCVLGRPFGIRQQVRLGMNVVLARDLTDAMYNPRRSPFVSHTRGTELVIEHIEKFWCPSILSEDLTRVVEGSVGP